MSPHTVKHPGERRWETNGLAVVTLALTAFGIASCYASASYLPDWYHQASQQVSAVLIGGVVFLVAAHMDYHIWRRFATPLFLATLAGLLVIAIAAVVWPKRGGPVERFIPFTNGAKRWIKVGVQIQVSEVARFTLAAWLAMRATQLGTKVRDFRQGFVPLMIAIGAVVVLVKVEPSVSMAVVLSVIGLAVIFTAGARVSHLTMVVLAGAAVVAVILVKDPVRNRRMTNFQGPSLACDPHNQSCESMIGFGNGGVLGVGYERGTQKLGHLPEASSDFLLSVIGEEHGFVGVVMVVLLFAIFCWLGFRIARSARDPFGTYLASGLVAAVGVTAFMHAAVVTELMPATGLTLPFMSAGRMSLILYLFSAGVIISIGRGRGRPAKSK